MNGIFCLKSVTTIIDIGKPSGNHETDNEGNKDESELRHSVIATKMREQKCFHVYRLKYNLVLFPNFSGHTFCVHIVKSYRTVCPSFFSDRIPGCLGEKL